MINQSIVKTERDVLCDECTEYIRKGEPVYEVLKDHIIYTYCRICFDEIMTDEDLETIEVQEVL